MQDTHDGRKKIATRLARVEGQLRGIKALVENGAECEDVAMQMTAARRALDRAFYEMLACSLMNELEEDSAIADVRESTDELMRLLVKFA
ncbi:MAG TPA: metal-sensitive transcriptional regulator [Rhodanobacteraceae bacterium]|nr:metal-sensitive transcriptional regulator [Rhodanobacteraceae bacterium]